MRDLGWRLLMATIGVGHAAAGVAFLVDGADGFTYSVFTAASAIPWWGWGTWALAAGVLSLIPLTHLVGLAGTALWYALWAAAISVGVVTADGPLYAIATYGTMAAAHGVVLCIEVDRRRDQRTAPR